MFPSGGYFRGINCPFFSSGLCERVYCHFRHVKTEEEKPVAKSGSSYADSLSDKPWNAPTSSSRTPTSESNEVRYNKYTGEPIQDDPYQNKKNVGENINKYSGLPETNTNHEEYSVELNHHENKYTRTKYTGKPVQYNKYTGEPIYPSDLSIDDCSGDRSEEFPEYNPTPINELRRNTDGTKQKYTLGKPCTVSSQEYDPESNFSSNSGGISRQTTKRSFSYDPTNPNFDHPIKKARGSEYEFDISKFSDDDEMEEKEKKEEESNDEKEKLPIITDVKVFESLLINRHENGEQHGISSGKNTKKNHTSSMTKNRPSHTANASQKVQDKMNSHIPDILRKSILGCASDSKSKILKTNKDLKNLDSHSSKSHSSSKSEKSKGSISTSHSSSHSDKKDNSSSKSKSHSSKNSGHSSSEKVPSSSSNGKSEKDKHRSSSSSSKEKSKSSKTKSSSSSSSSSRERSSSKSKSHSEDNSQKIHKSRINSERKYSSDSQGKNESKHDNQKGRNSEKKHMKSSGSVRERTTSSGSDSAKKKILDINVNLFGEDSDTASVGNADDVGDSSDDDDFVDVSDIEMEPVDAYDECLKIFNEHIASQPSPKKKEKAKAPEQETNAVGKKRMAHKTDTQVKRKAPERPVHKPSPAEVLHNRLLMMKQKALEEAEAKSKAEASSSSSSAAAATNKISTKEIGKKREAHKPVFGSGTKVVDGKTVMATASKVEKRKAHTPNVSNLKRPTIPAEFGSKVPTNVRQRYLNAMIDECLKVCKSEEKAFKRGQEEEMAVYKRSTSKTVYLNLSCNTIKRIRTEASENMPSGSKQAPTGVMKLSHEAMLGGKKAVMNSYTLNRSGGSHKGPLENFSGAELYKRLEKYILTEEQLKDNGFPHPDPDDSSKVLITSENALKSKKANLKAYEKICVRCGKKFVVYPNGTYANKEECVYHWGKAWKKRIAGYMDTRYTCCQGDLGAEGCQVAKLHVHETNKWDNLTGFMKTLPCSPTLDGDYGVYAMDCEMIYTSGGVELARVTVTDPGNATVYETLIRPDRKVIDYNTRFSGITEDDMKGVVSTLRDAQAVLLSLFTEKTILIGHSLESDLAAVKLIHRTVVDTSVVFPHRLGPPYKRALKTLMAEYLQRIIQDDVGGHDSQEDATSCMDLMHWRLKEDARKEPRRST